MINETFKPIVEMTTLRTKRTGIPGFTLYISQREGQHGPRIKVYLANQVRASAPNCSYSISDNPEWKVGKLKLNSTYDKMVKKWIILNKDLLLWFWDSISNDELVDTEWLLGSIKKID